MTEDFLRLEQEAAEEHDHSLLRFSLIVAPATLIGRSNVFSMDTNVCRTCCSSVYADTYLLRGVAP